MGGSGGGMGGAGGSGGSGGRQQGGMPFNPAAPIGMFGRWASQSLGGEQGMIVSFPPIILVDRWASVPLDKMMPLSEIVGKVMQAPESMGGGIRGGCVCIPFGGFRYDENPEPLADLRIKMKRCKIPGSQDWEDDMLGWVLPSPLPTHLPGHC